MKINLPLAIAAALLLCPPVQAATSIDETRPLDARAEVEISNVRGSIKVTGSDRSDIRITGSIGEDAKGLIIEGDDKRLQVRVDYPESNGWGGWWGSGDVDDSHLVIELPTGVELAVESVSATVRVDNLRGERLKVESVSGDIEVKAAAVEVELSAVSSDIELELDGSQSVDLESVSGDLILSGRVTESIEAETVSGNVDVDLADSALAKFSGNTVSGDLKLRIGLADGGRLGIEALSGDVELSLPAATSATLRVESFSGDIRSAFGEVKSEDAGPGSSLRATLGEGSGQIRVESFSGDVRIESR